MELATQEKTTTLTEFYPTNLWVVTGIQYLPPNPIQTEAPRLLQRAPKYKKTYLHLLTGDKFTKTDVDTIKYRRQCAYKEFAQTYYDAAFNHNPSIFIYGIIANISEYPSVSNLLRSLTTLMQRNNMEIKGYIWQRDVGENKHEPHYHILAAIHIDSAEIFERLLRKKMKNDNKVNADNIFTFEKQITMGMANNYLPKKDVYAGYRERAFGRSKKFKI
jgi:hypothetical protein